MEKIVQLCNMYLASLKTLALIHKHNHWIVSGDYSLHLLFDRAYENANENIDVAAEKLIGIFIEGEEIDDLQFQGSLISDLLIKYKSNGLKSGILSEKDFIKFSQEFYSFLEEEKLLTLGLENCLQDISDKHENIIYLLSKHV